MARTKVRPQVVELDGDEMTQDLAALIGKHAPWLSAQNFLDKIDSNLEKAIA